LFKALKGAFTLVLVLAYYNYIKKIVVEIDVLNWASSGVLSQYNNNGKLRLVVFFSVKYSTLEYNYKIYNKELLAIIKALEKWRPKL
jgi:hypothetical protein